ncbi:MAG: shikimate dehydrogenase [Verrucomicrobiota bacterium]|nr:shikimate dehydrogenase [Verrucomicrobiota bacterium]
MNAATRCCAVFGSPIAHSASPAMHNAAFAALGLNWRYLAFEVTPRDLRAALEGARAMRFAGLNLTVPHKLAALEWVDTLDGSAKTCGAVNTIHLETTRGGKIRAVGFNTDADALMAALREELGFEPRGAKVLLLGAGGAGQAAALKFAAENVGALCLANRTQARAKAVADEIKQRFPAVHLMVGWPESAVDLAVNATSLGLKADDPSPLDERQFSLRRAGAVFDMIYRPPQTALLRAARAAGCRAANGLGMLLHQGAKAFEIWTGRPAPLEVMRHALEKSIYG